MTHRSQTKRAAFDRAFHDGERRAGLDRFKLADVRALDVRMVQEFGIM